jgi:DNA-binding transcriptional regulator YiaG
VIDMTTLAVDNLVEAEEAAEQARVKSLEQLRDVLASAEKNDVGRDAFHTLFVIALRMLELDQDTAARIMKASRPTVSRWMSGQAAPHRVGRPSVFRELRKVANDRLRQHSSARGEVGYRLEA